MRAIREYLFGPKTKGGPEEGWPMCCPDCGWLFFSGPRDGYLACTVCH
jgi:hypothetical protein